MFVTLRLIWPNKGIYLTANSLRLPLDDDGDSYTYLLKFPKYQSLEIHVISLSNKGRSVLLDLPF